MLKIIMRFYCFSLLFLFTLSVGSISHVRFQEGCTPTGKLEYSKEQFLLEETIKSRGTTWPSFYNIRCFFQKSVLRKLRIWRFYSSFKQWFGTLFKKRSFPYSKSLVVSAVSSRPLADNEVFINFLNHESIMIRNNTVFDYSSNTVANERTAIPHKIDIVTNNYNLSLISNYGANVILDNTTIPIKLANQFTIIPQRADTITNIYDLSTNPKYGLDDRGTAVPYENPKPVLEWGGISFSTKDIENIEILRGRISKLKTNETTTWLINCTDVELVRFLRSTNNNLENTWKSILRHAEWRIKPDGAESLLWNDTMEHHPLHREIFWMGLNKLDCPILVIRTTAHDGLDYNYDAKVFVRFFAAVMEQGKREFGLGSTRQACVIMDRHPVEWMSQKEEKFDLTVLRSLVELFRLLYDTLMNHYPDILDSAKVIPASWIFQACYSITSKIMDKTNREKFELVKFKDVNSVLSTILTAEQIPVHFGGLNFNYGKFPVNATSSNNINITDTKNLTSKDSIKYTTIDNNVNINRKTNLITNSINEDTRNNRK